MSMTNEQKAIVQETFALVPDADALALRFYDNLFELDPTTKPMFKGDMREQRMKLMQTLAVVVNNLNTFDTIVSAIESLGKRHVDYGVTVDHWHSVGAALLMTLKDIFGDAFTAEVEEAWSAAYHAIAQTAINATYSVDIEAS